MKLSVASIRRMCRRLHYWFGLGLAVPFLVVAVTGCILGFGRELDTLLCPDLYRVSGPDRTVSAQSVLDSAAARSPLPIIGLQLPDATAPVWIVSQGTGKGENMGVQQETFFDPQDGRVLGARSTAEAPIRWVHRLHNAFLLGPDGRQVVGVLALVMMGMIVTGIVVWWRPARGVRHSFLPKMGQGTRLLLDLHVAAAAWPFLLIVLVTVTGITMEFPQATRAVLGQSGAAHAMGRPTRLPANPYPVSADQALDIAHQAAPDDQLVSLALPSPDHLHWRVTLRPSHGFWLNRRQMMIDAQSGLIHRDAGSAAGLAAAYLTMQHGLHGGAIFGLIGRLVVVATGLCLAVLTISGALIWARRHLRRRRDGLDCDCSQDLMAENT